MINFDIYNVNDDELIFKVNIDTNIGKNEIYNLKNLVYSSSDGYISHIKNTLDDKIFDLSINTHDNNYIYINHYDIHTFAIEEKI